jgi:transaldolase
VKDPSLPDTLYVTELAAPNTVNTMPEKTLDATFDHGVIYGDGVRGTYEESESVIAQLDGLGISLDEVTSLLEREGVEKFVVSWNELLGIVETSLKASR